MGVWWLIVLVGFGEWAAGAVPSWKVVGNTRLITIRQGQLRGLVLEGREEHSNLHRVEVYLGIPYAAPPVGSQRFMPPGSPPPWPKLKFANTMGPVCPQVLPELDQNPRMISSGRLSYLKRLLPYLRNQSEDCLHLNIYAPEPEFNTSPSRLPVIVFIHGESFQWNSGNPYDGSILASYSSVIVVTINFRLGILGFLKPGVDAHTLSNFGLLDQIAALQWVKDNIVYFGGDPTSVTLLGHHTGAVAVNYMMLSPVVQAGDTGLFHRAILMSGSALADWAEVRHPEHTTIQVAEALNCPTATEELLGCLRRKRVSDLLAIPLTPSQLGPTVDGHVLPNRPKNSMSQYTDLFSRYDLLCGVTEAESYHMLDAVSLAHGMLDVERDKLLKEYFRNTFQMHPEMAQAKATSLYSETEKGRSTAENTREATIALLSDARVVAPVVQTALYHSVAAATDVKTFLYVFSHRSSYSEFPSAEKSVHGEELPYVLGIPFDGPRFHFHNNYNQPEKLLSEVVMTMWGNFAKTGDPNYPQRHNYVSQSKRDWLQYDIKWPTFERNEQAYYNIAIPPNIEYKYRDSMVRFWNEFLPQFVRNPIRMERPKYPMALPPWVPEDPRSYPDTWPFPVRQHRPTSKPSYGVMKFHQEDAKKDLSHMDSPKPTEPEPEAEHMSSAYSFAINMMFMVGTCFLIINIVIFMRDCYNKRRAKKEASARYTRGSSPSLPETEESRLKKDQEKAEVKSILKSSEGSYEPVKQRAEKLGRWPGMYRQGSSSTVTMDPHTKVTEWIAQEIVHRCSPGYLRRNKHTEKSADFDRVSSATTSKIPRASHKKIKKVSVAVDATPSARSASVLKQIPIELTKSLDTGAKKLGGRPALQRSLAVDEEEVLKPSHVHSYSDPVQTDPSDVEAGNQGEEKRDSDTTDEDDQSEGKDINVTCRDEATPSALTPEESLDNIKRRNFPKVLPDFPESDSEVQAAHKRLSMPQYSIVGSQEHGKKVPPPPPPRVSTLGRKAANRNTVPNFLTGYSESGVPLDRVHRRPEPKVIIKPTLSDPKTRKGNPQIPRVKHQPIEADYADLPVIHHSPKKEIRRLEFPPGIGAQLKIQPVKKSPSAETSSSSVSTDDTVMENKLD